MTGAATLLWPLLGFLTIAAFASWWQARAAKRELEQSDERCAGDFLALSQRQEEIGQFKKSRERRAAVIAALALALLIVVLLATGSV